MGVEPQRIALGPGSEAGALQLYALPQCLSSPTRGYWIPAFAGMTRVVNDVQTPRRLHFLCCNPDRKEPSAARQARLRAGRKPAPAEARAKRGIAVSKI